MLLPRHLPVHKRLKLHTCYNSIEDAIQHVSFSELAYKPPSCQVRHRSSLVAWEQQHMLPTLQYGTFTAVLLQQLN
jgi:hypothetical protein